jgi:very-short-patch-repair endonuclease
MAYIGKTREPAFQFSADQTTNDLAKELRRKMTPSEKLLWQRLRNHKISGLKFRRQHPIRWYIADFYCHEARLVIEVDGPIHQNADRAEHDRQRDGVMEELGIKVLRFSNNQVRFHLPRVLKEIKNTAVARLSGVAKNADNTTR